MRVLGAFSAFSLVTIAFFTWFSNYGIPLIEPAPPPVEEKLDLGAMGMDQFVALGERIFNGKGTCTLCHNPVGGRAPLLDNVAKAAAERMADARYKGEADDVAGYLEESMVAPSAYVVAGFGKAGTGDTVSPMPNAATGGARLNEAEIKAVIAYLQDASGLEVTVEIPSGTEAEADASGEARAALASPEDAISEFGCGACHKVADEEGEEGPDLRRIGRLRDRDYLRRAILDPNADITKGFEPDTMPGDYGEQMYAKELEMVVDYLAGLR